MTFFLNKIGSESCTMFFCKFCLFSLDVFHESPATRFVYLLSFAANLCEFVNDLRPSPRVHRAL